MTVSEIVKQFGNLEMKFRNYYKYQFFFFVNVGNRTIVGTIGDGTPDDIYRFDLSNNDKYRITDIEWDEIWVSGDKL